MVRRDHTHALAPQPIICTCATRVCRTWRSRWQHRALPQRWNWWRQHWRVWWHIRQRATRCLPAHIVEDRLSAPCRTIYGCPVGLSVRLNRKDRADADCGAVAHDCAGRLAVLRFTVAAVNALATWKEISDGQRSFASGLGPGTPNCMSVKSARCWTGAHQRRVFPQPGGAGRPAPSWDGIMQRRRWNTRWSIPSPRNHIQDPNYNRCCRPSTTIGWTIDEPRESEDVIVLCEGDPFFFTGRSCICTAASGPREVGKSLLVSRCRGCCGHGASDHLGR